MNIGISMTCDWCNGELELFPQSKSGLRCKKCWRTVGNDAGAYSIKSKMKRAKEAKKNDNK